MGNDGHVEAVPSGKVAIVQFAGRLSGSGFSALLAGEGWKKAGLEVITAFGFTGHWWRGSSRKACSHA